MLAHACKVGLEGVVSKVRDSLYVSGRNNDWVKKTCVQRETLSIAGFALEGNDWDGLYLGRRRGNDSFTRARSITALTKRPQVNFAGGLRLSPADLSHTASASPTRAYVSNLSCWRKSNIGRSRRKAKSGIPSTVACGRILEC